MIEGKFYTLFAFLFGVGFALQFNRAEQRGQRFVLRYLWRTVLLYAIGLVHIVVLWDGDILALYATAGGLLLLCMGFKRLLLDWPVRKLSKKGRQRARRWPILVLAGILLLGPLAAFGGFTIYAYQLHSAAQAGETLTESEQELLDKVMKASRDTEGEKKRLEDEKKYEHGSYVDVVRHRVGNLGGPLFFPPVWLLFLSLFLIGAYVGRHRFIERAEELRRGFKRLCLYGFAIGIPLSVWFVWAKLMLAEERYPWWEFTVTSTKTLSGLAMGLGIIAAVTLAMLTRAKRWLQVLAPVGRMALSNYLLQSVIGTFLFYGYGLGLMGRLTPFGQLGLCVVILAGQTALSHWWLNRYRFGPVEWLWRSATYFKRQPMRV